RRAHAAHHAPRARGVAGPPAAAPRHREVLRRAVVSGLRDRYCVVGVGETEYSRDSGRSTRAMAVEAIRAAVLDAGLRPAEVAGMLSYQLADSTPAPRSEERRVGKEGGAR